MKTNLYADFYCLRSSFRRILLIVFVLGSIGMRAQTVPVGMPFFEDALRRGQLMGVLDPNVSFMVRPVDPGKAMGISNPFGLDTVLFPLDSNHYSRYTDLNYSLDLSSGNGKKFNRASAENKSNLRFTLLPVYTHSRYNKHHPYGWSDGAMIPTKGGEQYVSAGLFVKAFFLEAQLRPEFVWSQNNPFQNPPFRSADIDMPERMGQSNYNKLSLGQSYVKVALGAISVGLSNENIWWGPGIKNAIVMSNNAPGFGHFTLHTNQPIKTRIGTFEGELVSGKLKHSGYTYPLRYAAGTWPPIAGDVIPDTSLDSKYHSYFTGMTLTWQPKWTPGLFLGVSRIAQGKGEPEKLKDYLSVFSLAGKQQIVSGGTVENAVNRNQIISVFARYLFAESHAEAYMEIGKEDNWWDLEDLLTRPRYSTAYLIGLRKMYSLPGKDRWLMFDGEYTKIQAPMDNIGSRSSSESYSFYTHSNGIGWTNEGQVLGAGIGPGSNMFTLGGSYGKGFNTFGIHFEHIAYNEDLFYTMIDYLKLGGTSNPFFVDASKHFIDWGILLNYHTSYKKLLMGFQAQILRTYNFQWNYDPYGGAGPFRFTGINVWSLNAELSLVYRF
jgi:hypothetical protein